MKTIDRIFTFILLLSPSLLLGVGMIAMYSTYGNDAWVLKNKPDLFCTHNLGAYELMQDRDSAKQFFPDQEFLSGVCPDHSPEDSIWYPTWKGLCSPIDNDCLTSS